MNPQAPNPTPADDRPVTPTARRLGPPIAAGAVVVATGLLAWLALAPTAIEGPISEAPFTVPATLVVPPDDDGCLLLIEGDGTTREHCLDQLATTGDEFRFVEAYFDDQDRLVAGESPNLLHIDPVTGEVLGTVDVSDGDPGADKQQRPAPEDERIEAPEESLAWPLEVYSRGDQVVRVDTTGGGQETSEEVLLDLEAPPGYQLRDAVLSPDEAWVVAITPSDQIIVAPADGSSPPYVWTEVSGDRWVDLWRAIRWDT